MMVDYLHTVGLGVCQFFAAYAVNLLVKQDAWKTNQKTFQQKLEMSVETMKCQLQEYYRGREREGVKSFEFQD